jgi:non-specific serine/threonine protein kinase
MPAAPPEKLPLPLLLLRRTEPGLLYYLASKPHLVAAAGRCDSAVVASAEWGGNSVLTLVCVDGQRVTFTATDRLVPHCSCAAWTKQSQCPHVVVTWIQLKRILTPSSFSQIRISDWVLNDLADLLNLSPDYAGGTPGGIAAAAPLPVGADTASSCAAAGATPVRFVLDVDYGRLYGAFWRGGERIQRWTAGLPRDVMLCIQRHPIFDATMRHLVAIMSATGGRYPVVFRDDSGSECPLVLRPDAPRRACLSFTLGEGMVSITRTVDGTGEMPDNSIVAQELLLDLEGGGIHPLVNAAIWRIWDNIGAALRRGGGEYASGERANDGQGLPSSGTNRLVTEREHFNGLCLRLGQDLERVFGESLLFHQEGSAADTSVRRDALCLLDLPSRLDAPLISLRPQVSCDGARYPFSSDLFGYFDPLRRAHLPAPLKAKKRVRTIVEACFALGDAGTPAAARNVIKTALGGPDYLKRGTKSGARQILNSFAEERGRKPIMVQALADGWRFSEDDRLAQIRLMRILYDFFGSELSETWDEYEGMTVEREALLAVLPRLADRLQQEGFLLRVGEEPLASAVWDFSLDATTSTLDWFELRPEIRCDGELISGDELQQLARGGVLQRDGRLILIDDMSARILAMLAGVVAPGKRRKKGEQRVARIPRLQILDWLQLRSHGVRVRLAPGDAQVLESLVHFERIPRRQLPSGLNATLRPYQRDGYHWLAFLYEHRFGACLADDMGLGKTVQGISLLAGIADGAIASGAEAHAPHLIVVPPSLLFNWESEIARFFPAASLLIYAGPGRSCDDFGCHDIILTSYGIVQRDIETLAHLRFNVIIFDEAQVVKNLKAATTGAARRLVGAFKLALTGTPVENRIEEYYAVMDLCLPGLLGTPEEFRRRVAGQGEAGLDILLRRTRPFVLRRNKQLISADLPEKIETDIILELSPKQRALYQRTIEEVRGQINEAFSSRSPGQARIIALTALLRLRQICLAPSLALPGSSDSSPKLDFLVEQLAELRDEGHSVLVFSQFTSYLDMVEEALKRNHLPSLRLDGSTPTPQRKRLVQGFQHSDSPLVFLISLKAGGKGLNLTRATYVYHLDPWWNPAVENQASDRAHRLGQTRQVTITRLIMRHTIEEKMMALKEQKQKLYRAILEEGSGGKGAGLTREDLDFLLG